MAASVGRVTLVFSDRLVDQLRHPDTGFDRVVVGELQLRHRVEVEAPRELAAEEPGGSRERLRGILRRLLAREMREAHRRVRKVARDVDAGDRHRPDARVLDLVSKEIRALALDLVADAMGALGSTLHVLIPAPSAALRAPSPQ